MTYDMSTPNNPGYSLSGMMNAADGINFMQEATERQFRYILSKKKAEGDIICRIARIK